MKGVIKNGSVNPNSHSRKCLSNGVIIRVAYPSGNGPSRGYLDAGDVIFHRVYSDTQSGKE